GQRIRDGPAPQRERDAFPQLGHLHPVVRRDVLKRCPGQTPETALQQPFLQKASRRRELHVHRRPGYPNAKEAATGTPPHQPCPWPDAYPSPRPNSPSSSSVRPAERKSRSCSQMQYETNKSLLISSG